MFRNSTQYNIQIHTSPSICLYVSFLFFILLLLLLLCSHVCIIIYYNLNGLLLYTSNISQIDRGEHPCDDNTIESQWRSYITRAIIFIATIYLLIKVA